MEIQLIVAVIAAAASLIGAFLSWRSAGAATDGAKTIASTSHRVARLDRDAEQLREDFRQFVQAISSIREPVDIGHALAAGEVLMLNPWLDRKTLDCVESVEAALRPEANHAGLGDIEGVRLGVARGLASISQKREAVAGSKTLP